MSTARYLESEFNGGGGGLDGLLDQALISLKTQQKADTATPSVETKEAILRKGLPKLQTGIHADAFYLSTGNQQLLAGVALADDNGPATATGQSDATPLEQLEPAAMEDKRKISQQEKREERQKTSGKSWFDMPKAKVTPELERDWQIIQMRSVLDPKRHYRKDKRKAPPTYCQVGTIIEGATEFYSARMTRRERKQTILEEFLHDNSRRDYFRDRYRELQKERAKGTKAWRREQRSGRK